MKEGYTVYRRKKINEFFCKASCYSMIEYEDNIWFSWWNANGLYKMNNMTKRADLVATYENEPIEKEGMYHDVARIENYIIFPPNAAEKIAVYNIALGIMEYKTIKAVTDVRNEKYLTSSKFSFCKAYGSSVYMFPHSYPAIIKYDVKTDQILYISDWIKKIDERISKGDTNGYMTESVILGDIVWSGCGCLPILYKMDLKSEDITIYEIQTSLDGFYGLMFDGTDFWITGRGKNTNRVVRWNPDTELTREIIIDDSNWLDISDSFWSPMDIGEKVLVFPIMASHVYEIDKITEQVLIKRQFDEFFFNKREIVLNAHRVLRPYLNNQIIRFITGNDGVWHEYNWRTDEIYSYEVLIDNLPYTSLVMMYRKLFSSPIVELVENAALPERGMSIQEFLNCIKYGNKEIENSEKDKSLES